MFSWSQTSSAPVSLPPCHFEITQVRFLLFDRTVAPCFAENKRDKNGQIQKRERAHHKFVYTNELLYVHVCVCHLKFSVWVSSVSLCQCLNADGGHKAGGNCSKLTHIKGPLGLCSTVSATGDILGSKPFITLNVRCGPDLPSTQQVWRGATGQGSYRGMQRQREQMKVSILTLYGLHVCCRPVTWGHFIQKRR